MSEKDVVSGGAGPDEKHTVLFSQLVMQQSSLALMLLGRMPHPETGQTTRDLPSARLFIEQLEVLEARTRGNLTQYEDALLKQTLMTLHLAFVEAADAPAPAGPPPTPENKTAPEK